MFRTVVNLSTGSVDQIPLTIEEIAELQSRPAEPIQPVSCTSWQIRKALIQLNLDEQVEVHVQASTDKVLKAGWEYATEFRSDDPFVINMGSILGKTPVEVYDLILWASTL